MPPFVGMTNFHTSPEACPEASRRDEGFQPSPRETLNLRTWRSWRLGASNSSSAFKMRLIMAQWSHGETTTNRQSTGGESTADRCPHHRYGTTARGPSGAAPGAWPRQPWSKRRPSLGSVEPQWLDCSSACASRYGPTGEAAALGRPTQSAAQRRARGGVPGPVGRAGQGGGRVGAVADPRGLGAAVGPCRWPPRWCGGCWPDTGGARWPPIRATPRAIWWRSRRGKKTPRNAGCRREAGRSGRAFGAS